MSYLKFDKTQLINLEYSLSRELLRTNRAGSFSSSTLINCHTRRYHGLFICPLEHLDGGYHVLLSSLDETIIQHGKEFHLAVRKYPGIFHAGHKYIMDFQSEPIPSLVYRVGGVILKKEMLLVQDEETVLIRYTLEDAHSPTSIRLHPFLAFRNVKNLSKANMNVKTNFETVKNGIKTKMYDAYPNLYMQISKEAEYISAPDWFYNVEYMKDQERGYDCFEDLFVPGYFEFTMKKGDVVIFSGSLAETEPSNLKKKFEKDVKIRIPRDSYENCLENAAEQFLVRRGEQLELLTNYPFLSRRTRKIFISLPNLTLPFGKTNECKAVLETMSKRLLPNSTFFQETADKFTNTADTPFWYIWAIQQYAQYDRLGNVWELFGESIKQIFGVVKNCDMCCIKLHENGLIYAEDQQDHHPMTWMDSVVDDYMVTPRIGYAVEINALWYNSLCFALEVANKAGDQTFVDQWKNLPELVARSFVDTFWNETKGYLADYVNGQYKDWLIRPNQVIATALTFSPLTDEMKKSIIDIAKSDLLTSRGLRTLSPKSPEYIGFCEGTIRDRLKAYHQGTAWPWLLAPFAEAYLNLHERSGVALIEKLYQGFEQEMDKHGVGSISEMYDGNPPFNSRGAISNAMSVGAVLRMKQLIEKYK